LPAYLKKQHALVISHCPLPTVLQPLVAEYAAPTHEDMWNSGLPGNLDECSNPECGGIGPKRCSRCKQVRYCGRECQLAHWKAHKADCKRWSAELTAADA
jgi:hypothetical protein